MKYNEGQNVNTVTHTEVKSVKSHWFIDHFLKDLINIIKFIMQIGSQTNGFVHPIISFLRIMY